MWTFVLLRYLLSYLPPFLVVAVADDCCAPLPNTTAELRASSMAADIGSSQEVMGDDNRLALLAEGAVDGEQRRGLKPRRGTKRWAAHALRTLVG